MPQSAYLIWSHWEVWPLPFWPQNRVCWSLLPTTQENCKCDEIPTCSV